MNRFAWITFAAVLSGASSVSLAQAPGSTDQQMRGAMPDHPHLPSTTGVPNQSGNRQPMSNHKPDPQMRGAMPDHPHVPSTTGVPSK